MDNTPNTPNTPPEGQRPSDPKPYQSGPYSGPVAHVPNYLVWAILVTIFCCLPFGIPAIVYAAKVNGKLECGDYAGALEASKNAKTWIWVAFIVGLLFIILNFALGGFSAYIHQH